MNEKIKKVLKMTLGTLVFAAVFAWVVSQEPSEFGRPTVA
jgi:hypothetical protein